jgi:hypothetical protein
MLLPEKTVFVLGAGASCAYGFPSGHELLQKVGRSAISNPPAFVLAACLAPPDAAKDFGTRLLRSGSNSIDEFVGDAPQFSLMAKCFIAEYLFRRENDAAVCPDGTRYRAGEYEKGDWARELIRHLVQGGINQIKPATIITFNFDRSFERRIVTAIAARYGVSLEEAHVAAKPVRVLHASGWMGFPEWVGGDAPSVKTVHWGGEGPEPSAVKRAADQIVFVHEPRADESLIPARLAIREARLVCFLGFGFHPANLTALDLSNVVPGACRTEFIGSGLGFSTVEAQAIEARFPLPGAGLEICEGADCLKVLKEHPFLHGFNKRCRTERGQSLHRLS